VKNAIMNGNPVDHCPEYVQNVNHIIGTHLRKRKSTYDDMIIALQVRDWITSFFFS
jgi:hypothetical protein